MGIGLKNGNYVSLWEFNIKFLSDMVKLKFYGHIVLQLN